MKAIKESGRRYYKYQVTNWSQPVLSSNGTLGGDSFACAASSNNSSAYKALDNSSSNSDGTMWTSNTGLPQWLCWYNPIPIRISTMSMGSGYYGQESGTWGTLQGSNDGQNWTDLLTYSYELFWPMVSLFPPSGTGYYKYHRLYFTASGLETNGQPWVSMEWIRILATTRTVVEGTPSDYDFYELDDSLPPKYLLPADLTRKYYKEANFTEPGTYTYNITESGQWKITLIGGGGGCAQTDGGTDSYADTAWANHYGHNGANGGIFVGMANLTAGTLSITIGAVGQNRAGKGNTAGNGGDSYAIFTPNGGSPVEIARAGGGHSGYPEGIYYSAETPGGVVTYNSNYVTRVLEAKNGDSSGGITWSVYI